MRAPEGSILKKLKATCVVIENAKGGCGKTTITYLIARFLAKQEKKILLLDLDGQANLSRLFGMYMEDTPIGITSSRFYAGHPFEIEEVITKDIVPNIDIIPSHIQLFVEEQALDLSGLATNPNYPIGRVLRNKFEESVELLEEYDYIFFDCSPHMGELTYDSFAVADSIICPVDGTDALLGILATIRMWNTAKDIILDRVDADDYKKEKECLEEDNYFIIYNKYQQTKFGNHLYDVLRGQNLTARERLLFEDFDKAYVECPIPLRTVIQKDTYIERDDDNGQGLKKCVLDDNTKESIGVRESISTLVENLKEKGAL